MLGDSAVGQIKNLGTGGIDGAYSYRQTWRGDDEIPRSGAFEFPVAAFGWKPFVIEFTPEGSGYVQVTLTGHYDPVSGAADDLYKEEVWFDALTAEGVTLANASFETAVGGGASNWIGGILDSATARVPAADGARFLRVWQRDDATLRTGVTAHRPVRISGYARATLAPVDAPAAVTDPDSPAHQTARRLRRGVNLSGLFDVPPGDTWGWTYNRGELERIKQWGFDHIRLPVRWHDRAGGAPAYKLSASAFQPIDQVIQDGLALGLAVVVDMHGFDDFMRAPEAQADRLYRLWEQIGNHYAAAERGLCFELLNEPTDQGGFQASTRRMNPIYAECIRRLRLSNPGRSLLLSPSFWSHLDRLAELRFPDTDHNLLATCHCYEPHLFTHQGASWTRPETDTRSVIFPGPPAHPLPPSTTSTNNDWVAPWFAAYNSLPQERNPSGPAAFEDRLRLAEEWSRYFGRPVYMGEFGAYEQCPPDSRARYIGAIREAMERHGFGWALWDWRTSFGFWNPAASTPTAGFSDALFNRPLLTLRKDGASAALIVDSVPDAGTFSIVSANNAAFAAPATSAPIIRSNLLQAVRVGLTNDASFFRVKR